MEPNTQSGRGIVITVMPGIPSLKILWLVKLVEKMPSRRPRLVANFLNSPRLMRLQLLATRNVLKTEFPGLNEVLGGGILRGSVTLLARQPGIGKVSI